MDKDYDKQLKELQNPADTYDVLSNKLKSNMWARIFLWLNLNHKKKDKDFYSSKLMWELSLLDIDYINKILCSMVNIGLISRVGKKDRKTIYRISDTDKYLDDKTLINRARKTLKLE